MKEDTHESVTLLVQSAPPMERWRVNCMWRDSTKWRPCYS